MPEKPTTTMTTPGGTVLPLFLIERKTKNAATGRYEPLPPTPYLQVAHRLVWFREENEQWTIMTELVSVNNERCLARATIMEPGGRVIATAHKMEKPADFGDYIEKAETGAVGRALAMCGYGTQFAPELAEEHRIVDAPVAPAVHIVAHEGSPMIEERATPAVLAHTAQVTPEVALALCKQFGWEVLPDDIATRNAERVVFRRRVAQLVGINAYPSTYNGPLEAAKNHRRRLAFDVLRLGAPEGRTLNELTVAQWRVLNEKLLAMWSAKTGNSTTAHAAS